MLSLRRYIGDRRRAWQLPALGTVSPPALFFFFSRYFIHENPVRVFFSLGVIIAWLRVPLIVAGRAT